MCSCWCSGIRISISRPFDDMLKVLESHIKLYSRTTNQVTVDELSEIWRREIKNLFPIMNSFANLSNLIYLRYMDEKKKDSERIVSNQELNSEIIQKITNILQMELFFALVARLSTEIIQEYELTTEELEITTQTHIEAENHFDFIFSLFFSLDSLDGTLNSVSEYMNGIRELNQKARMFDLRDTAGNYDELTFNFFESQGKFLIDLFGKFTEQELPNFWIRDPFLEYLTFLIGSSRYEYLNQIESQSLPQETRFLYDQINMMKIPVSSSKAKFALARSFGILGNNLSTQGLHKIAIHYFNASVQILDELLRVFQISFNEESKLLLTEINSFQNEISLKLVLASLLVEFRNLHRGFDRKTPRTEISSKLDKMQDILKNQPNRVDIPYLSSIPSIFDSIITIYRIMIEQNKTDKEIKARGNHLFQLFHNRIQNATDQVVLNWGDITYESDTSELAIKIQKTLETVLLVKDAIVFTPPEMKERTRGLSRLTALENLSKSVLLEIAAINTNELNKIQELIFKIKAYYYAKSALDEAKSLEDSDIPLERIRVHYSGSYISAHTIEMHLFQLAAQYLCLTEVLPNLFLKVSNDPYMVEDKQKSLHEFISTMDQNNQFIELLTYIFEDCQRLLDHGEKVGHVVAQVKWDQILLRKQLIAVILQYYQSIRYLLIADWEQKLKLYDHISVSMDNARNAAFQCTKLLEANIPGIESFQEFAQNLFSYAQYCQNSYNALGEGKSIQIPAQQVFKLFRDMVFDI